MPAAQAINARSKGALISASRVLAVIRTNALSPANVINVERRGTASARALAHCGFSQAGFVGAICRRNQIAAPISTKTPPMMSFERAASVIIALRRLAVCACAPWESASRTVETPSAKASLMPVRARLGDRRPGRVLVAKAMNNSGLRCTLGRPSVKAQNIGTTAPLAKMVGQTGGL